MKNYCRKIFKWVFLFAAGIFLFAQSTYAHCQIPCGIYDDNARVMSMLEDVKTIEKAVNMIKDLSSSNDPQSHNQRVRWIMNKEQHAQNIIVTICDYFLTQRVKPEAEDYLQRLEKHHIVIVGAMKAKQNVDMDIVKKLKKDVEALLPFYPAHDH